MKRQFGESYRQASAELESRIKSGTAFNACLSRRVLRALTSSPP